MCAQALPEGFYREEIVFTPEETDSFGRGVQVHPLPP